ncbi:hypothetical protein IQ07DRAFT_589167 [Pyrenochaeta sp. DS3sAY3a]|nr:hypothetical protein IQ07DRAFT_589167 [Pyrenochaeta sp. DS3sAY3a]
MSTDDSHEPCPFIQSEDEARHSQRQPPSIDKKSNKENSLQTTFAPEASSSTAYVVFNREPIISSLTSVSMSDADDLSTTMVDSSFTSTRTDCGSVQNSDSIIFYDDETRVAKTESLCTPGSLDGMNDRLGNLEDSNALPHLDRTAQDSPHQSRLEPQSKDFVLLTDIQKPKERCVEANKGNPGVICINFVPKLSKIGGGFNFSRGLKRLAEHDPIHQFLGEDMKDAPWTVHCVRLPGSICAFCGVSFTGKDHLKQVSVHIRLRHVSQTKSSSTSSQLSTISPSLQTAKPSDRVASKSDDASMFNVTKAKNIELGHDTQFMNHDMFLRAMGSWVDFDAQKWREEHRPHNSRMIFNGPSHPRLIDADGSIIPQDRLLFLLNNLDPNVYPQRSVDFFDGLRRITNNLTSRFPEDNVVSGIQNALTTLENAWRLNFGTSLVQAANNTAHRATKDAKVCMITQNNDHTTPQNDSSWLPLENNTSGNPSLNQSRTDGYNGRDSRSFENIQESKEKRNDTMNAAPLLGCPFQKDSEVHNRGNRCGFQGAPNMWGITQHLKTRTHPESRSCLMLCRQCWEYTMDPIHYQNFHHPGHCPRTPQPRKLRVAEHWRSLYRTVCPYSERIPSPYVGNNDWTAANPPDSSLSRPSPQNIDFDFNSFNAGNSFLEQNLPAAIDGPPPTSIAHSSAVNATDRDAEIVAIGLFSQMLSEHVQQPFNQLDVSMQSLIQRTRYMEPDELNAFSSHVRSRVHDILDVLQTQAAVARTHIMDTGYETTPGINGPFTQGSLTGPPSAAFDNLGTMAFLQEPFSEPFDILASFDPLALEPTYPGFSNHAFMPDPEPALAPHGFRIGGGRDEAQPFVTA